MKNVFLFIHNEQDLARIIVGYTSLSKIKKAGLNVKADIVEKYADIIAVKKRCADLCVTAIKTHIK